jgi:hypothetical protein
MPPGVKKEGSIRCGRQLSGQNVPRKQMQEVRQRKGGGVDGRKLQSLPHVGLRHAVAKQTQFNVYCLERLSSL